MTTVAARVGGRTTYALEGAIFIAGAAVQWLNEALAIGGQRFFDDPIFHVFAPQPFHGQFERAFRGFIRHAYSASYRPLVRAMLTFESTT